MNTFKKNPEIIHKEFPDFFLHTIKKIGEGDNNLAFLINENYIFRFPKTESARHDLRKEIAFMPDIASCTHIPVPQFEFISKQLNFVGYQKIAGKFLTGTLYKHLSKKSQKTLLQSLGNFLTQLHGIDYSKYEVAPDVMNYSEEYSSDFETSQKIVFSNISRGQKETITKLFTAYLNDTKNFQYKPTLIHNDFSIDHILFSRKTNEISGIIDFGDLAVGDPDYDLMYLYDVFGKSFIKKLLKFYPVSNQKKLIQKLDFFSLANKIQILNNSIIKGDEDDIKHGYRTLKKWLKSYEHNHSS